MNACRTMSWIIIGFALSFVFIADSALAGLAYVRLDPNSHIDSDSLVERMQSTGIEVAHIFPQEGFIVHVMNEQTGVLGGFPGVAEVITEHDRGDLLMKGGATSRAEEIFLYLTAPDPAKQYPAAHASWPAGGCVQRPELPPGYQPSPKQEGLMGPTVPSVSLYTAEYMAGRVALVVMLMESAGSAENWTTNQQNIALAEIVQGADWLSSQAALHGVRLSWVYEFHTAVPTAYEPIDGRSVPYYSPVFPPLSWEFEWIDDALSHLGVGSEWDGVLQLANTRRQTYKTDWSYEVYIVMDANDADHKFSNGEFAYYMPYYECCDWTAWPPFYDYPSPLVVMTFNNDSWGWWNMDRVFSHETGHVFGAPDEYTPACSDCGGEFGYLHVPNGNCQRCNPSSTPCIMRGDDVSTICGYTVGHWGWNDSDGDGPVDAIDPNYPYWASLFPVAEGDVVRVLGYDENGAKALVKTIAVTENNRDAQTPPGYIIWDALNNYGWHVAPGIYTFTINNGSEHGFNFNAGNPAIKPSITGITFSGRLLSYRLENSFAYVRCFLYDENTGQLVGRPVWDRQRTADHTYSATVDTAALMGPAIARFYAWRAEGGASPVTEFPIAVPKRGDINVNNIAYEVGDAVLFSSYFVYGNAVWDPLHRDAQIGATDVNGDGQVLTLSDFVYLLRIVTMDCPPLGKPSVNLPTSSVSWEIREDSLIVGWNSEVAAGAMLLHFDHKGGEFGQPALTDRAGGATVLSHDDGSQLRVLVYGMGKEGSIAAGDGPILTIPVRGAEMSPTLSKVEAVDWSGNTIPAARGASADLPRRFALYQNVPNPFNAATRISFCLPSEGEASLRVYNVLGQLIVNLAEGTLGPGQHEFAWDGADSHGLPVATGVYFYSLHFKDAVLSRKMVTVK